MAKAAFLLSATSSAACSTVKLPSWLITDITISIIICRRRILRCSSSFSWGDWGVGGELSVWWEDSSLRSDSLDPIFDSPSSEFTLLALLRMLYPKRRQGNTKKVWLPPRQRPAVTELPDRK